jgi:hypothetical protein
MPKMLYPSLTGVEPGEVALIKLEGRLRGSSSRPA